MPRPPRWILLLCLALGALLALSAGLGLARAISAELVNWFVVGFESLLLIAGIFAIGSGLGRFRDGPALAMLCAGGTALVAATLAYTAGHKGYTGIDRDALSVARLAAACGLMGLAALTAMARRPHASAGSALRGVMMLTLAAATVAPLAAPSARAALGRLHPVLESVVFLTLGALTIVCLSAAAHHLIRALEHGKDPPHEPERGPSASG